MIFGGPLDPWTPTLKKGTLLREWKMIMKLNLLRNRSCPTGADASAAAPCYDESTTLLHMLRIGRSLVQSPSPQQLL